jgi:hypothetical protein
MDLADGLAHIYQWQHSDQLEADALLLSENLDRPATTLYKLVAEDPDRLLDNGEGLFLALRKTSGFLCAMEECAANRYDAIDLAEYAQWVAVAGELFDQLDCPDQKVEEVGDLFYFFLEALTTMIAEYHQTEDILLEGS